MIHIGRQRYFLAIGGTTVALIFVAIAVKAFMSNGSGAVRGNGSNTTLVIIVAGTWGNTAFWPNVVPGEATFASELRTAAGSSAEVLPFLWASSIGHADRLAAARNLAKLIDEKSPQYGRVCLVAHSHGGNVALLAAGMAQGRVDMVVCLSTPHLELQCRDSSGKNVDVPVYCTAATQRNVRSIVNIVPDTDSVPDGWANWRTGISDTDAVDMTADARAALGNPRLRDDGGLLTDMIGVTQRVIAGRKLDNVPCARQVVIQSFVPDSFGSGAHVVIHSRRMGCIVGRLIAGGGDDDSLRYAESVVQPADADDGSPVPDAQQQQWRDRNQSAFALAGWRLDDIALTLAPQAKAAADNLDGSDPESVLKIVRRDPHGDTAVGNTTDAQVGYSPHWQPKAICFEGGTYRLTVTPNHTMPFVGGHDLGSQWVTIPKDGSGPVATLSDDIDRRIYWSAALKWRPVHY